MLATDYATPSGLLKDAWQTCLNVWSDQLTQTCRNIDPRSTDETLAEVNE